MDEDDALNALLVATVVSDIVEVLADVEIVEDGDVILLLIDAVQLPGMHCEYQSLECVQQDPEAHVIGPAVTLAVHASYRP